MSAKEFLQQECGNIAHLLDSTLKRDYGLEGSKDFYDECSARLKYLESDLKAAAPLDHDKLSELGSQLNTLSKLICRIERSSLGEYSWPFVEELKGIASVICTENSLKGGDIPHKVYVLADGGLDAYRIFPEVKRPSASKRLILTIVFPKTLKDFVLLHSILGHELGHAIYRCSKHQSFAKKNIIPQITSGILASETSAATHLFSTKAPTAVQTALFPFTFRGFNSGNFFQWASWSAWIEELFCDFVGLLTFGPSFVAAQCTLLGTLDPSGVSVSPTHPLVSWRINAVIRCAELEGFDQPLAMDNPLASPWKQFWDRMKAYRNADPWHDVLTDAQLSGMLGQLKALLHGHLPASYPAANEAVIGDLYSKLAIDVPPTGFNATGQAAMTIEKVDFRHILYAGWIAAESGASDRFETINRLCQHAIMQQRGIDLFMKGGI